MSITANSLLRDSLNFFKNQRSGLLTLALIATTVSLVIYYLMIPNQEMVKLVFDAQTRLSDSGQSGLQDWVQNLSGDNKSDLLRVSLGLLLSVILGNLLLVTGALSYIYGWSKGENMGATHALSASLPVLPSMFVLLTICALLIQLGIALMVIPGVLFAIGFSLSPAILLVEKRGPFQAMKKSWSLAFSQWRLVLPMIMIWMASQVVISLVLKQLIILPGAVVHGLSFFLNNLVSIFALIYFFRLTMLNSPPQPADKP